MTEHQWTVVGGGICIACAGRQQLLLRQGMPACPGGVEYEPDGALTRCPCCASPILLRADATTSVMACACCSIADRPPVFDSVQQGRKWFAWRGQVLRAAWRGPFAPPFPSPESQETAQGLARDLFATDPELRARLIGIVDAPVAAALATWQPSEALIDKAWANEADLRERAVTRATAIDARRRALRGGAP